MDDLFINKRLTIPGKDLRMMTSTASGPGGQRVNRVQTRVTIVLDIEACDAMGEPRRRLLRSRLARRVGSDGTIRVVCGRHRSQRDNIAEACERLAALIRGGLAPTRARRSTQPTRASKRRRLEAKGRQGQKKQVRGWSWDRER
ncbi:MAG: alternative ribosome rescue aminoacyl-tRNA hydrolase ArfB [Phycisphaerales bacterium]|jgi:ribosome-associated protein|nr:alternative ribosome rescue aminoacyl-tRNA hydrolase ArfB [Phycisphaerales bacterium]